MTSDCSYPTVINEPCCETPFEELCDAALEHYERLATEGMHWNSLVPAAIKFYKKNYNSSPTTIKGSDNE